MKKRSEMRRSSFITITLSVVTVLSIVFSFTLWAGAVDREDLDAAIDVMNAAKQSLEEARAEAARLGELKNMLPEDVLLLMLDEISSVYSIGMKRDADMYMAQMTAIYGDATLSDFQRHNELAGALDDWNADVNSKIDGLMVTIGGLCDQYSEFPPGYDVDAELAKQALLWETDVQRDVIINTILNTDFDPAAVVPPQEEPGEPEVPDGNVSDDTVSGDEVPGDVVSGGEVPGDAVSGGELSDAVDPPEVPGQSDIIGSTGDQETPEIEPPKTAAEIMYEVIDAAGRNTEAAVIDLPNWVKYCVDVAIDWHNIDNLERTFYEAKLEAGRLYNEIYGYDYAVTLSSNTYNQGSGKDIKVHINGAHGLVKYFLYFDIYAPIWSDEAGDYVLYSQFLSEGADYVISEGENGTIDITIKSGILDRLACGAQNFSVYYAEDEGLEPSEIFIEVMPKIEPQEPENPEEPEEPEEPEYTVQTDTPPAGGETTAAANDTGSLEEAVLPEISEDTAGQSVAGGVKKPAEITTSKEADYQKTGFWETILKIVPLVLAGGGIILMTVRIIRAKKKKRA